MLTKVTTAATMATPIVPSTTIKAMSQLPVYLPLEMAVEVAVEGFLQWFDAHWLGAIGQNRASGAVVAVRWVAPLK